MAASQVLMISRDPSLIGKVREECSSLGALNLRIVGGIEEASTEQADGDDRLVVVHLDGAVDRSRLATMMGDGATGTQARPYVVVSETYRVEEAIDLFRMGVADYLSRADHLEKIASVVKSLIVEDGESMSSPSSMVYPRPKLMRSMANSTVS